MPEDTMFASDGEVPIEFDDGWVVWIKEEMPYGFQDDLENNQVRLQLQARRNGGDKEETQEAHIALGNVQLLQLMVTKFVDPDGKTFQVTKGLIRRMTRQRVARILDEINQLNPPFSTLLKKPESEVLG